MGKKVSVETGRLREGASTLSAATGGARGLAIGAGDLGSPRADAAFEGSEAYWSTGRAALKQSTEALAGVLRSAADVYEHRDAESARQLSGGSVAF